MVKPGTRFLWVVSLVCACVGCDQLSKNLAREGLAGSEPISYFQNLLRLQYAENPGAFLGLGGGNPAEVRFWIFTLAVGLVLAGLLAYLLLSPSNNGARLLALSLVLGGGTGNLIDRIFHQGQVIDFMNIGLGSWRTGIFNFADVAISLGVLWLCALALKSPGKSPAS